MESRWFNTLVVLVWLTTTTWLVVAKVVPPLKRGDPPNYRSMYTAETEDGKEPPAVGWDMSIDGKPLGWAVTHLNTNSSANVGDQVTKVKSYIHFERIPLEELSPAWMRALVHSAIAPGDNLSMDAYSELTIDPLGHLSQFLSVLRVADLPNAIRIRGKVQASMLKTTVETDSWIYPWETYLPSDALVADELSPQARLNGLHVGQEWTVPVFSPLRDPRSPVEVLQAQVESSEFLMWQDRAVPVNLVVYRADSGSALSSTREPRVKLWVGEDGTVLKQEVSMLNSKIQFIRMSQKRSERVARISEPREGPLVLRNPRPHAPSDDQSNADNPPEPDDANSIDAQN
jgi:hypothetical protein